MVGRLTRAWVRGAKRQAQGADWVFGGTATPSPALVWMVRHLPVSITVGTLWGTVLAWAAFGELGLPVLFCGLGALVINAVGFLIQRERMQFYGYLPPASKAESEPQD
ncbi:hypothetical protein AB0M19_02105 [Streptomyces sp. NPDC051920]|uniref:hypothetical protein n=1 Tax=Streptomyces sp. NPDC051920 TaxID=3155523 RepID=UPI0034385314